MRVVVDLQAFPVAATGSEDLDHYSAALAEAVLSLSGHHEIQAVINHSSEELVEDLQDKFPGLFQKNASRVAHLPFLGASSINTHWHRAAAELMREHTLLQLKADVLLCAPLTGLARLLISKPRYLAAPSAIVISALPPAVSSHTSSDNGAGRGLASSRNGVYATKARPYELILTASEHCRRVLLGATELPPDRVVVVPPPVDAQFRAGLPEAQAHDALRRLPISQDFVLSITDGSEQGVERLLEAYALLPQEVRQLNQLVIAGAINGGEARLLQLARSNELADGELLLVGEASDDELAVLSNTCKLVIFAGSEERAARQALRAMNSGVPVVGPDHSRMREILGSGEAVFDPSSARLASEKICQALASEAFRERLKLHAVEQARRFAWEASARRSLEALEQLYASRSAKSKPRLSSSKRRPRMAYVSPLPPERSGIADYSAELLPELARYYDIELITDLAEIADPLLKRQFRRVPLWEFEKSARDYDRILYHIGNSPFHFQIPSLLERHPGTLVLHDFFLSHLFHEFEAIDSVAFWRNLYVSHGYPGLIARTRKDVMEAVWAYPCNWAVLSHAAGIVVHSEQARQLARQWFGMSAEGWKVIPQLRRIPRGANRQKARKILGISPDTFLVCSFGFLSAAKLNDLLLWSWLGSSLSREPNCRLVFVGGDGAGRPYQVNGLPSSQIQATGYLSKLEYELYLAATDVGVQLRSELSRGETPRSVLDCMAQGIATVVSSHPALSDLPGDSVFKISESGGQQELIAALEKLYREPRHRADLGQRAQEYVRARRSPAVIARQYVAAVEEAASNHPVSLEHRIVLDSAKLLAEARPSNEELATIASFIAENTNTAGTRQLFVDVSILAMMGDFRTGIQRVTRAILAHLLENPPAGWRVEPVFRRHLDTYRYARSFVRSYLGLDGFNLEDAPVAVNPGDVFLGLDWDAGIAIDDRAANWLLHHRQRGMRTVFTIYDLLPLQHPEWFKPEMQSVFHGWLSRICRLVDGFACISRAVADHLLEWLEQYSALATRAFDIGHFQLGSDIESSWASRGLSPDDQKLLGILKGREVLLMVGTVEPRKGHSQALSAIEHLWSAGENVCLIICGQRGWMVDSFAERLRSHPEIGHRLFWLEQATDETLLQLYSTASALLMASEGEGFGLPLVEAARHALPIITRDLAVFREVAGEHAFYFSGTDSNQLAGALRRWLKLYRRGEHPRSSRPPTWEQSTQQLLQIALDGTAYRRWQGRSASPLRERTPEVAADGAAAHLPEDSFSHHPALRDGAS